MQYVTAMQREREKKKHNFICIRTAGKELLCQRVLLCCACYVIIVPEI